MRRFQAYGVGMQKTGTHSLAGLFQPHYRAEHEPEACSTIAHVVLYENGMRDGIGAYLHKRDQQLQLELESSQLLFYFAEPLVHEFPDAKFILTIREPRSWLESVVNHVATWPVGGPEWDELRTVRYRGLESDYDYEERDLYQYGVLPLSTLLGYWVKHNQTILETVPKERLFILPTDQISDRINALANFLQIPATTLNPANGHLYETPFKFDLLDRLPYGYLNHKINLHCKSFRERYFLV